MIELLKLHYWSPRLMWASFGGNWFPSGPEGITATDCTQERVSHWRAPGTANAVILEFMESISAGEFARLPDGTRILIDEVHSDGYASGRR